MIVRYLARRAFAGAVILSFCSSAVLAATNQYCWKSNGKKVCVGASSKPKECAAKPCVVTYASGNGGNNKPVLEMPNQASVAPENDISKGLDLKTFDAGKFSAPAKLNAQTMKNAAH